MVVEPRHLRVYGTNVAEYPVTSMSYRVNPVNFNGIATWTLARPLGADKILLQLDAHSPDGVRMAGNPIDPPLLDGDRDGRPAETSAFGSSHCRVMGGRGLSALVTSRQYAVASARQSTKAGSGPMTTTRGST
jgi:hypothetical protein